MPSSDMAFGLATAITKDTISPKILGQWMEARGFESLWFGEHSHLPIDHSDRPSGRKIPEAFKELHDPFLTLMAVAAATTTLKLGTSVLILPEHHPIRLAKTLATLDRLSGGRLIVGIGSGWSPEELADFGIDFKDRWRWVREVVLAMREIWNNDIASFSGEMVKFKPMHCGPKPLQAGGPPILMGAQGKYAIPRIVEYCEGWIPLDHGENLTLVADLREQLAQSGRSIDALDLSVLVGVTSEFYEGDNAAKRIDELYALGFRRILFAMDHGPVDWDDLERIARIMRRWTESRRLMSVE